MSLKYKILWFEDDREIVEDYSEEIKEYLEDFGFELELIHQESGTRISQLIKDDFDLILTDLNLGENETGDILIREIRNNNVLTEILFYSGNPEGIKNILQRHEWVERVSFSVGIEYLVQKIKELIYNTIRKLQDINNMRGLVLAETSQLDVLMEQVINNFISIYDDEVANEKKKEIYDKTIDNRRDRIKSIEKLSPFDIDSLYKFLETNDKVRAINRLIKFTHNNLKNNLFAENTAVLSSYKNDIMDKRNALAHAKQIELENGVNVVQSYVNGVTLTFDDHSCSKIRKDIKKHELNFMEMLSKVEALPIRRS